MHPHLHRVDNAGCEEIVQAFEECHARGFLWKSMGMCNDLKRSLTECLKAERAKHQLENRNNTNDKMRQVRAKWKEIDENS
ncbi:hypothetical protein MCOR27_008778 [Pyricularia oryzae]|uniref:COX assembly mitochondrial protein n=3 Tax=Pyricularia TaxID=48558 RepID=A0ABQ8NBE7_PYRGI|nr:uncharacterized protein MGG_14807 [Pyricularia oryzae 70-15]KAH8839057.1 hypothetical protein MCOR01_008292 [Pyricularia oryzae]KAI6294370.1 hypothetical protein MCOR33_008485 [Pyricularia grisea]EHA54830.1 hypothetical protein MGG_14807 [Pyricularia oryzae 70-15]KAI6257409.1 hypothetical protein MCOR19_006152 [Pyricularia oryzae]KAI6265807.1 hypothetical protein MCOR26_010528 [Pyricularia oryzae]